LRPDSSFRKRVASASSAALFQKATPDGDHRIGSDDDRVGTAFCDDLRF
jgi:hypothetical protein